MKHLFLSIAILVLGSGAGAAETRGTPDQSSVPADEPMRFVVVRSSHADCEPKCAEWISAEGKIVSTTAEQFAGLMRSLGQRKLPVLVSSPGGSLGVAIDMG